MKNEFYGKKNNDKLINDDNNKDINDISLLSFYRIFKDKNCHKILGNLVCNKLCRMYNKILYLSECLFVRLFVFVVSLQYLMGYNFQQNYINKTW